jgi:hypothetical protein
MMSLARLLPNTRETPEETYERVWRMHGMVVVSIDDPKMPWDLREQLARFMTRQHGIRNAQRRQP